MRGHIAKKGDSYYVVIDDGPDPATGKSRGRWHAAGPSRNEAERLLVDLTSDSARRKELLMALLDQHADDLDRAAEEIGEFFDHLRRIGIRSFVAENANDADCLYPSESGPNVSDHQDEPADSSSSEPPHDSSPGSYTDPASCTRGSR